MTTGIYLNGQPTTKENGEIAAFDADWGILIAYNGKMIPEYDYRLELREEMGENTYGLTLKDHNGIEQW